MFALRWSCLVSCLVLGAPACLAVTAGQVDAFESPGTAGWSGGLISGPSRLSAGGVGGGGYLELSTEDFHLGAFNQVQWAGDYLSAGVTAIEADFLPGGPDDVAMRILLFGPGGPWATEAISHLTTGAGWQHAVIPLDNMIYLPGGSADDGTGVLADTLADVQTFLLRNDTDFPTTPGTHPPHITAVLGVDNIRAVPEPTALALLAAGAAMLRRRRRA